MGRILRIALIGAPNSGKSKLFNYLKENTPDEYYHIFIGEPISNLFDLGVNPFSTLSRLYFQFKCLDEYASLYERVDDIAQIPENNKDTVIFYNTTPILGRYYIDDYLDKDLFEDKYNEYLDIFNKHTPDLIFNLEVLQGNSYDRYESMLGTDNILSIESDINEDYPSSNIVKLSNILDVEERADEIIRYIEGYFKSTTYTVDMNDVKITINQACSYCGWIGAVNYKNPYNYCPMCGRVINYRCEDPLGLEKRNKMFYVDPKNLPRY